LRVTQPVSKANKVKFFAGHGAESSGAEIAWVLLDLFLILDEWCAADVWIFQGLGLNMRRYYINIGSSGAYVWYHGKKRIIGFMGPI